MRIPVLGTGPVGQTVAAKLVDLGHEGIVETRSVEAAMQVRMFNLEVVR